MSGRPFLQIPGPTLVPERIVRAMSQSIIDHRGPKFAALVGEILTGLKTVFQTERGQADPVPGLGHGRLGSGRREHAVARRPGSRGRQRPLLESLLPDGRGARDRGGPPRGALRRGRAGAARGRAAPRRLHPPVRAVLVVHNETSTGVTSDVAAVRRALDEARHPALLLVDVVSSLASIDFRFDEWGVDVALTGPQKGLMLPPGLTILAASERAVRASQAAKCPRAYWDWGPVLERNKRGEFPYTPATALLFGLRESIAMLEEEGLPEVFRRHARLAEACRRAVRALGLGILCRDAREHSNTLTAVVMPPGFDSDAYIVHANRTLDMSLGIGLGDVKGKVFRIGHLGSLNELELLAGLAGVEMTLKSFGVPVTLGAGVAAAQSYLMESRPS